VGDPNPNPNPDPDLALTMGQRCTMGLKASLCVRKTEWGLWVLEVAECDWVGGWMKEAVTLHLP
jgi:hypothetical protein